jgi:hypothetical protein
VVLLGFLYQQPKTGEPCIALSKYYQPSRLVGILLNTGFWAQQNWWQKIMLED